MDEISKTGSAELELPADDDLDFLRPSKLDVPRRYDSRSWLHARSWQDIAKDICSDNRKAFDDKYYPRPKDGKLHLRYASIYPFMDIQNALIRETVRPKQDGAFVLGVGVLITLVFAAIMIPELGLLSLLVLLVGIILSVVSASIVYGATSIAKVAKRREIVEATERGEEIEALCRKAITDAQIIWKRKKDKRRTELVKLLKNPDPGA